MERCNGNPFAGASSTKQWKYLEEMVTFYRDRTRSNLSDRSVRKNKMFATISYVEIAAKSRCGAWGEWCLSDDGSGDWCHRKNGLP